MLFNWIPLMAILIMLRALAKIVIMVILAMMATTVMVNGNLSMAIRGVQLKSMKKLAH